VKSGLIGRTPLMDVSQWLSLVLDLRSWEQTTNWDLAMQSGIRSGLPGVEDIQEFVGDVLAVVRHTRAGKVP